MPFSSVSVFVSASVSVCISLTTLEIRHTELREAAPVHNGNGVIQHLNPRNEIILADPFENETKALRAHLEFAVLFCADKKTRDKIPQRSFAPFVFQI